MANRGLKARKLASAALGHRFSELGTEVAEKRKRCRSGKLFTHIAKGMIWSPSHGDTAFTVPLFDEFMQRIMPGEDWAA